MLYLLVAYEGLIEILHHDFSKINLGSRNTFLWGIWKKKILIQVIISLCIIYNHIWLQSELLTNQLRLTAVRKCLAV